MKIPTGKSGFPTVSASQLRTYGAGGFRLDEQEQERGCPALYRAKYVDKTVDDSHRDPNGPLAFGSFFHDVLYRIENDGLTPDEALDKAFPVDMDPALYAEARKDLYAYLERGASPTDRFGTIAVENDLHAELYVDEEFGPIWYRGILDWIGVDLDLPQVIHGVDYKTNRTPPREEDVRGDVQMKGYAWLLKQHMDKWGGRRVVMHLDCVKWREVEVAYTDAQIEEWHAWAVAVVRKILRDTEGKPQVNPGCDFCPIKRGCPAFLGLPQVAADMATGIRTLDDPVERLAWRDAANGVRLLLEKSVKGIDEEFKAQALAAGRLDVGDTEWVLTPDWKTEADLRSLHRVLGGAFYEAVSTSKAALDRVTVDLDASTMAEVNACFTRTPAGTKVVKRKKGKG